MSPVPNSPISKHMISSDVPKFVRFLLLERPVFCGGSFPHNINGSTLLDSFVGALETAKDPSGGIAAPLYAAMFIFFCWLLSTEGHRKNAHVCTSLGCCIPKNVYSYTIDPIHGTCGKGVVYLGNIPYPHLDQVFIVPGKFVALPSDATSCGAVCPIRPFAETTPVNVALGSGDADVSFHLDRSPRFQSYRTQRRRDLNKWYCLFIIFHPLVFSHLKWKRKHVTSNSVRCMEVSIKGTFSPSLNTAASFTCFCFVFKPFQASSHWMNEHDYQTWFTHYANKSISAISAV